MGKFLTWLKSLELHRLAGTVIALIFGVGAVYIVVTQTIVHGAFDPLFLATRTHLLEVVALAGVFCLSASFRPLRWLQPVVTGMIGLVALVLTPEGYLAYVFITITTALLIRYDFFKAWALPKALSILGALIAASILGRLLAGQPVVLAAEQVVVLVSLASFLYLFFSKYIDPHLGGTPKPEYFPLEPLGFTKLEASVLEQVLIPQRTIKEIAMTSDRSESTIANHLQSIYRKVGCGHTRTELVAFFAGKVVVWDEAEAKARRLWSVGRKS